MKLIKQYRTVVVDTLETAMLFVEKLHRHGYRDVTISETLDATVDGGKYYVLHFECYSDREYSLLEWFVFV